MKLHLEIERNRREPPVDNRQLVPVGSSEGTSTRLNAIGSAIGTDLINQGAAPVKRFLGRPEDMENQEVAAAEK